MIDSGSSTIQAVQYSN